MSIRCMRIIQKMIPSLLAQEYISDNISLLPLIVEKSVKLMKSCSNMNSTIGSTIICSISSSMYFAKDINTQNYTLLEKKAIFSMESILLDFFIAFMQKYLYNIEYVRSSVFCQGPVSR